MSWVNQTAFTDDPFGEPKDWYKNRRPFKLTVNGVKVVFVDGIFYGGRATRKNLCDIRVWAPLPKVGELKTRYIYTFIPASELTSRQITKIMRHFR